MSIQDLVFIVALVALLIKRDLKWFVIAGLTCMLISIPLFSFWIFFTAQKLTYYAAAFFTIACFIYLFKKS